MAAKVEGRQLRVFCPTHRINFEVAEAGRILCESGGHALAHGFPRENFWEYCCDCQVFWPSEMDKGGKAKEACPVCTRATARRYLCDECKLVSIESDDPARRKTFRITTGGAIDPSCPGCERSAGRDLQEHACEEVAATFKTALSKCPFCEEQIKKVASAKPGDKIFCGTCGTQAAPHHSFCKNCGGPVGAKAAAPGSGTTPPAPNVAPDFSTPYAPGAAAPGPASVYVPPEFIVRDGPPPVNESLHGTAPPAPKNSAGAFVAVGVVMFIVVLIIVGAVISSKSSGGGGVVSNYSTGSQFKEKLDRAMSAGHFFAPSGSCVADLYDAEAARSPGSSALKEAASEIRTRLEPIGDNAIQSYYAESDSTIDWDYITKVYGLLKKVAPDNLEYKARYAYSLGLINLKNKSYATAVTNFQEALRHRPNWVMAYNGLGRVYVQEDWNERDYGKTVEYYRKACDLDTSFTWGCRNLGAYYMKVEEWASAEEYMSKALQRSPGRDTIWKAMAKICPRVGKFQDSSTGLCYSY